MNTKLTIENTGPGALLCTLDMPMGEAERLSVTMLLPKNSGRTASQLEYQLLLSAKERLAELCSQHQESKRA